MSKELFEKVRTGDKSAFESVFRTYYAPLCSFANNYIADASMAEEIVQDLFCQIWERHAALSINESLKSYLFRSVRNRCLNHFRHQKVKEAHQKIVLQEFSGTEEQNVQGQIQRMELDQKIARVIANLPDQCHRVFTLSRFDNLKYKEIAQQLNISVKAVEAHISKALKTLRKELKEYIPTIILMFYIYLENFLH